MALAGEAMSFRRRLLLLFSVTVLVSVAVVTGIVSTLARRAFDRASDQRTAALVDQFHREFENRGEDISQRIQSIAAGTEPNRMVIAAAQRTPDYSPFLDTGQMIAEAHRLDFLEFADDRGTIISSAQWPAKFGYTEALVARGIQTAPFLKEEDLPTGPAPGLFAIRAIRAADRRLYIIGGTRLDKSFLASLQPPAGMRVMLYESLGDEGFSPDHLISQEGSLENARLLEPLVQRVQQSGHSSEAMVHWKSGDESMSAFPLAGADRRVLGVLVIGSSRQIDTQLRGEIRSAALFAAGAGLVLAMVLSSWAAARVTKPVEELAKTAQEVAAGNWQARVEVNSRDEIGKLADSFNRMTRELLQQQERLIQSERVAAWRELARRLAHELKNPLFPLQLTVENLLRSREHGQQQFDETFTESAGTLLSEISNLKAIIARFSDFSKMPQPQFQPVKINELVESAAKVHQAQLAAAQISCKVEAPPADPIAADAELLHRALSNLILNAIEAMPQNGTLSLRTQQRGDSARIEISDTGKGLSSEECARLFTPYYTSKPAGTGLGLAIVQSIISDHGGRISVSSELGRGTTFMIELPANRDKLATGQGTHV